MKQANIQITFEEEKLRALRRYIAKRDSTLEAELPQPAREAASRADTASRETKRVYFIALHLKNKITGIV